jgi:putative transposase
LPFRPNIAVARILGFLKGKSSIWIAQNVANKQRNFVGHKFWARGYFVSTVGADEQVVKTYIQNQEKEDKRIDDLFNRS